jgi:hypothetical protein
MWKYRKTCVAITTLHCAIGIFFICYRGSDLFENWTANFASLASIGIALLPIDADRDPLNQTSIAGLLHTFFGGLFFLTLAVYALYHFPRTTLGIRVKTLDEKRDAIYRLCGLTIVGSMGAMSIYLFLLWGWPKELLQRLKFLFWMEWAAVWAFAISWLTKGHAILARVDHEYHDE